MFASENFEHASRAHAATDAHRHVHFLGATAFAFDQRMDREALSAHAIGMHARQVAHRRQHFTGRASHALGEVYGFFQHRFGRASQLVERFWPGKQASRSLSC